MSFSCFLRFLMVSLVTCTSWIALGADQKAEDLTSRFDLLPDFRLERVYKVPNNQGSWVALTVDDNGRILAADQYGKIYRVTPPVPDDPAAETEVEALDVALTGAHGLLWAHDSLYVVVSEGARGAYRVMDSNGDGELDRVERLHQLTGGGEHGPHGMVLSPDGKWIYMVAGNNTRVPEFHHSLAPEFWDEDQLLSSRPDPLGHARTFRAPGGWVGRFTPDGSRWELVSIGYRNAYGLAFNHHGDLFTYDSDMEWDFGAPWYRPTRINHVTSGSEFGWRTGTGKWPVYYEDSLPPVIDIGPGSPTGVVLGKGLKFPARYQHALFMLDWTFATIYAVHFTPEGATYTADPEEFLSGAGLPVTDAVVGADGTLYFAAGGRRTASALYRVIYTGSEPVSPVAGPAMESEVKELHRLRRDLEALHVQPDPTRLAAIWEALGHEDRFIRFAARTALEHLSPAQWTERLDEESDSWRVIMAGMALARTGEGADQGVALAALDRLDPVQLDEARRINLMRAYGLVFARHGEPDEAQRKRLVERLDPLYPAESDDLNRELCRILVYLKAPGVLPKTLRLMASTTASSAPAWAELASRNERYGPQIRAMIENMPSEQNLFYAYCLRTLEGPWTEGQRRQFFSWLAEAEQRTGGLSYRGFVEDIRNETLERATLEERQMIESWALTERRNPFENLPVAEGPGRPWTVDEAVAVAEKGLVGRDLERGKRMFQATLCAACHRVGSEGGAAGPDLTTVGGRFSIVDLVEAIILPNKVVSDQYAFDLISMKDGSSMTAKIVDETEDAWIVARNPFDFADTTEVKRDAVETIEPSPVSPMPPGLIYRLNEDELRDLLAYLMKGE